jgi:DMSO/TMAO reductase YedYZ molybdopterin-dependent catalytic subunit
MPGVVIRSDNPLNTELELSSLHDPVTPVERFFKRNHFPFPPAVGEEWEVVIGGGSDADMTYTLADLRGRGDRSIESVLECAGNGRSMFEPATEGTPWDLGAVSSGRWRGTALWPLLQDAGIPDDAAHVLFVGADHSPDEAPYTRSMPLKAVRDHDVLLAWELGHRPLPHEHGGPVRLLVPGWYGMASVKWLREIRFLQEPFVGRFQTEEYVVPEADGSRGVTITLPRAILVEPADGDIVGSPVDIRGWAWSGGAPVRRVELRVGNDVLEADLGPDRGRYAWRAFHLVVFAGRGPMTLAACAEDMDGRRQPDAATWNPGGYENNSVQKISVTVDPSKDAQS